MLFWLMLCAAVGVLLFVLGAFTELSDVWSHPDHRLSEEDAFEEKHRSGSHRPYNPRR